MHLECTRCVEPFCVRDVMSLTNYRLCRGGDTIEIDIPNRRLDLMVDQDELDKRKKAWKPPESKLSGVLERYQRMVGDASEGSVIS